MGDIEDALFKHLSREDMMDIIGTSVSDEKTG